MLPLEVVDNIIDDVIKFGIKEGAERANAQSNDQEPTPPTEPTPSTKVTVPIQPTATPPTEVTPPTAPPKGTSDIKLSIDLGPLPKKTVISKTGIKGGKKNRKGHKSKGSGNRHLFNKSASTDGPAFLDPFSLQPSTSRMSVAWSTTSTRDDGSMPPSPTELDAIALRMVGNNIEDYSSLIADMVIRGALASLRQSNDISTQLMKQVQDTPSQAKIDSFLHSLEEAGPVPDSEERLLVPYSPRWYSLQKNTLRPVATGNWGCGAFKGDPQLKAMLQWMAVSTVGRPEMKYCTFKDARMEQVSNI